MSIACDFCLKLAKRHEDVFFVEAPSRMVQICEECIADAVNTVAARKRQGSQSDQSPP